MRADLCVRPILFILMRKYFLVFSILFLVFCLYLVGCVSTEYNVATHKRDIMFYSTEKEVAMGQNINKQVAAQFTFSSNPDYLERVNRIGNQLVEVCDRKEINYYFYVIDKDEKNAFAIPGGRIYIFQGLLEKLNDSELAFVLAHEIGHIVSRHGIKRLQAAMGYNLLLIASIAAQGNPQFTSGLSFALGQIMSGYSREDELKADELAVKYCEKIAVDPKAGLAVLELLYQEGKKETHEISYFRSHPYTAQRKRRIKETLRMPLNIEDYANL